ncbi:MAG: hypothetical protein HYU63_04495 [Armatimonadetes bacterium]|nr:hypothetical protein [Armatimonadota bacterium]
MSLNHSKINQIIKIEDLNICLRVAAEEDMDDIKQLYYKVYGGKYPLLEINDADKMKWAINDPNYLWLLNEYQGKIAGSLIFVVDPRHRIGKSMAAVVDPEYRGHKLTIINLSVGLKYLMQEKNLCDLIYAVVRTFVSLNFHKDLQELGFIDLGIFPNVRKVKYYETHGLKVCFKPGTLERRKTIPVLTPVVNQIYEICQKKLKLENALIEDPILPEVASLKMDLYIEKSPDIEWEYYKHRDGGKLLFDFFPLHYPQLKLYNKNHQTEAYIHFQEIDGHASLIGLRTDQNDLTGLLNLISLYAEGMGIKYFEILISAFEPVLMKMAYEASFLPCAYFPAAKVDLNGKRIDYVIFSRCFVPLNFQGLRLYKESKPYALAFYRIYSNKIWEELERA